MIRTTHNRGFVCLTCTVIGSTLENELKATQVFVTKFAAKQLPKLPRHIRAALDAWRDAVERDGIAVTRKRPGYHDEPLKGDRAGQRSVRLNRAYRAIYVESETEELIVIAIVEVNKHDY